MSKKRQSTPSTEAFYRENHAKQTYEFVLEKKRHYGKLNQGQYTVWDMVERLDKIVDESDPDTNLPQSHHAYQTAESLRKAGYPDWLVLVGFIHDLGKVLTFWGEPQWAVVGDIFPVGCAFEDTVVHHEYFQLNPDSKHPIYSTKNGIYQEHCGFDNVEFSLSHDWYLWKVLSEQSILPPEALYIIRYHSFYAHHSENGYKHLAGPIDEEMMKYVKLFQPHDLYSKEDEQVDVEHLEPYYQTLVNKYVPGVLRW